MFKPVHTIYGGSLQLGIVGSDLVMTPDADSFFAFVYALGAVDHTYVKLGTGRNIEVVKVTNPTSGIVEIERAKDGTQARPWPAGTPMEYLFVSDAVTDMIAQNPLPTVITLTSDDGTVEIEDKGGYVYDLSVLPTTIEALDDTMEIQVGTDDTGVHYTIGVNRAALIGCPNTSNSSGGGG